MNPSKSQAQITRQLPRVREIACFCGLVALLPAIGCQRRAHTELYVESINARNRDLEDQLYKYDYEYRMLEQELLSLREENAELRRSDFSGQKERSSNPLRFFSPRPDPPSERRTPDSEAANSNEAPDRAAPSSIMESGDPAGSTENLPSPSGSSSASPDDEFDLEQLAPPNIDPGEAMPPPLPARSTRADNGSDALQRNLGQVEIPALLASQRRAVDEADNASPESIELAPAFGGASLSPAVAELKDTRVVELAFHPSLSRAANFDSEADDDGLYLVLQPKNESGQVIPIEADLSIVVLDPARSGDAARISRRDYSANEVKAKIQSSGKHQGIHVTMPWNGPDPEADRVIVFARYTFPDGRQVIGEKTIFVSPDGTMRTVWAPRARSSGSQKSPVRPASHHEASEPGEKGRVIPAGTTRSSTRIVRPKVGSTTSPKAPSP